jgi:hypothetical protein
LYISSASLKYRKSLQIKANEILPTFNKRKKAERFQKIFKKNQINEKLEQFQMREKKKNLNFFIEFLKS